MHYVCSDIHGQYALYQEMISLLALKEEDTLYVLGDMIDRGPESMGVLLDMMARPNIIPFIGNHEWMMLSYLEDGLYEDNWFDHRNDGLKTYKSYKALPKEQQEAVRRYLKAAYLQLTVEVDGCTYALHHSYLIESDPLKDFRYEEAPKEDMFDCVWNSPYRFWEHVNPQSYADGRIHIIGHVPAFSIPENKEHLLPYPNPELGEDLLNIDGGCASLFFGESGGLFAMSLEKDAKGKRREIFLPG